MKQSLMNETLAELLRQRQQLEDNARAMLGLDIRVDFHAYDHDARTPAQAQLHRQLFDAVLAHPDGEYGEHKNSRWGEVNHPDDEFRRYLTVFTDLPPSNAQLKKLAARKARKEKK